MSGVMAVPLGMPTVLLFAQAREAVGRSKVTSDCITVAGVIEELTETYGEAFSDVVATSRIWCNGEPVAPDAEVGPQDELAVLPPVSGG